MGYTEKLPNGRWKGTYRGSDGRERSRTFARKIDADNFWTTAEADKVRGQWVDPRLGRQTFGEYAETWRAAQVHDVATAAEVERTLRLHILRRSGTGGWQRSDLRRSRLGSRPAARFWRRRRSR